MRNIFKKVSVIALALVMTVSLTACSAKKADMSATEFHKYLGCSEKDVLEFLGVSESNIKKEQAGENQSDITLKDKFTYDGQKATVKLSFTDDKLLIVQYMFTENGEDSQKAAFKYAKAIDETVGENYTSVKNGKTKFAEITEDDFGKSGKDFAASSDYEFDGYDEIMQLFKNSPLYKGFNALSVSVNMQKLETQDGNKAAQVSVMIRPITVQK